MNAAGRSSKHLDLIVLLLMFPLATSAGAQPVFNQYRVPVTEGCRASRDLEFFWSNTYATAPLNRPLVPPGGGQNDLDRFGRSLAEEYANPFGFPMTDIQIVHDYLAFPIPALRTYDSTCVNPGFLITPPGPVEERSHIDTYIYAPYINRSPGSPWYEPDPSIPTGCYDTNFNGHGCPRNYGQWRSSFQSPDEDLSTGGTVYHDNSIMLPGPVPSMVGVTGPNAWTRQSGGWSGMWIHEFQHALNNGQPGGIMTEVFSSAAQAIAGERGDGRFDHDVPYTRSLWESNYEGWRGFTAYLAYHFRGADTTFGGRGDDLLWRWAHGSDRQITGLRPRLNDAECQECQTKPYLDGRSGHDRLQIIMQNWRVANYVNNSAIADGQYGYPPQFDFIPSRDVGNWRDINADPLAINSLVIPPEVTLNKGNVTREASFVGMRYTPASGGGMDSTEMSLAAFGSEYWVVKAGPDVRDANRTLVTRITPLATPKNCWGFFDGRLLATLVAYNVPVDSLATWNNMWKHPEWAVAAQGPVELDVDSLRGDIELVLGNFGQTYNAMLVVLSLGEADIAPYMYAASILSERLLPYGISFGFRTSPFLSTNPVAMLADTSATDSRLAWNPAGNEVVFARQPHGSPYAQIWRKKTDATPAQPLFTMSPTSSVYFVDWSPRGDWVAYDHSPDLSATWDIWAYNIQTQENRRLTTYADDDVFPSFSPNGQILVYWRYLGGGGAGSWSLRKVNLDGTGDALLAGQLNGPAAPARWSPDGLTIYFFESGGPVKSVPAGGGTPTVRSEFGTAHNAELSPGDGKALVEERGNIPHCQGQQTAYARLGLRDLSAQKTDVRIFRSARRAQFPRYARNGTHVAFGWSPDNPATDYDLYYGTVTYNHAPVFSGISASDQVLESCVLFVRNLSATDPDGEPITYKISQAPPGLQLQGGNQLRWTPDNSQLGDHYVALRACDPSGGADWKVIKLTVEDTGWCEFECPPGHNCYPARATPAREGPGLPVEFALGQNLPNPVKDETLIRLAVPRSTEVSLDILDVQGRLVSRVIAGPMEPGYYSLTWDRRDVRGNHVGPGIYFYRMRGGNFVARRKMVLLP